jgi:hypothetical protein
VKAYFERASEALAKGSAAPRALTPRQVAGALNGLVRDLRHVESLLLGLDGFDNVARPVPELGVVLRDNQAARVGVGKTVNGVASLRCGGFRATLLILFIGSMLAAATLSIGFASWIVPLNCCWTRYIPKRRAMSDMRTCLRHWRQFPYNIPPSVLPSDWPHPKARTTAAASDTGCHKKPTIEATVLEYDDMNVWFAQVNSKLHRLLTVMQKGRAPAGEKGEIS